MLVSLAEYAAKHGKSGDTIRRYAENGHIHSAHKIGRNWVVEIDEPYPVSKRQTEEPVTLVSLFSGCGGMDMGFRGDFDFLGKHYDKNGIDIIWANEINHDACTTYRKNLGDIVEGDINEVIGQLPEYADIVIGGFPCQDISINGKMAGINGKRSSLYTAIVEAVSKIRPKVFVAENVGSLMLKKHDESRRKILEDFSSLGYKIHYQVYHAEDYGVPQTRERVFIVGTRGDMPAFVPPAETTLFNPVTAKEALADLEERPRDEAFSHIWSEAKVSGEQGNRKLVADRPGYTMRAECHGNIQFHYSLPRRISMREAARIQSFPDTFVFPTGLRATERQIGNAVPPVLAWHVAQSVLSVIKKEDKK
ncbi:MAG: DNA cytosine methyltransferase [Victivallales bacterium]|nr:DNA cytosine methyltransferase [Victivallales bacterium]